MNPEISYVRLCSDSRHPSFFEPIDITYERLKHCGYIFESASDHHVHIFRLKLSTHMYIRIYICM